VPVTTIIIAALVSMPFLIWLAAIMSAAAGRFEPRTRQLIVLSTIPAILGCYLMILRAFLAATA
jgi:hypothetical protein